LVFDMDILLQKSTLSGTVNAIASKSAVHRLLICAALADSPTFVDFNGYSKDINSTLQCISALGCEIHTTDSGVLVHPAKNSGQSPHLDCGECGSALRFLLPVAAALYEEFSMTGEAGLCRRPIGELEKAMAAKGCKLSADSLPFTGKGKLRCGTYELPGNVSSQYISGLLFALPILEGDSEIILTSPLSSAAYVRLTIDALEQFGIVVQHTEKGWHIPGGQIYRSPGRVIAEGDWSNAAVWLCAGAISGSVTVTGLDMNSAQADKAILDLLESIGADVKTGKNFVTVSHKELKSMDVNIDQFPDLMPVLTVTLAMAVGESLITGGARLRIKESDRIAAMHKTLSALGVASAEGEDSLTICGGTVAGGRVDSEGDHRIVMAAALASAKGHVAITNYEAIEKSYPDFFRHFAQLGGGIK